MKRLKIFLSFLFVMVLTIAANKVNAVNVERIKNYGKLMEYDYKFKPITGDNVTHKFTYTITRNGVVDNNCMTYYGGGFQYAGGSHEWTNYMLILKDNAYFNGTEDIMFRFEGVATYDGRLVDCIVHFNPKARTADADSVSYFRERSDGKSAIGWYNNFYRGMIYFGTNGSEVSYQLVYNGTNDNIEKNTMYFTWGSVNSFEGIASKNANTTYYLMEGAQTAIGTRNELAAAGANKSVSSMDHYGRGGNEIWTVGLDNQNGAYDFWGVNGFEYTMTGMKVTNDSDKIYRFSTLSHDFWFTPMFGPIGSTAPDPVKSVKSKYVETWTNDTKVYVGDEVQYKVTQGVQDRRYGGTGYVAYGSMVMKDELPNEVEYISAYLADDDGKVINNAGTLNYDKGSHTVTFTFSKTYLNGGDGNMQYAGENYNLIINTKVTSKAVDGKAFENKGVVEFNGKSSVKTTNKVTVTPYYKKGKLTISKEDIETGKTTQGDAKFAGAQYSIYADEACTQLYETVTLNDSGNGESQVYHIVDYNGNGNYVYREDYYIKETKAPEGYLIDNNVYSIHIESDDFPVPGTAEVTLKTIGTTSPERVIKSNVRVVKSLDKFTNTTESNPAAGCKLYLTLDSSNGEKVYETTIDEFGRGEFKDIPYGRYTITESKEAREAGYKLMDSEPIYVEKDKEVHKVDYYRIIEENRIKAFVNVIKKDAESKATILKPNTKYKIWSYAENKYLELMSYPSGTISEFLTGDAGEFTTPDRLEVGKYKLVELTPPEGYHTADIDFEIKDGVYENAETVPTVTVNQEDLAQKARIRVTKTAEVLTGVKQSTDKDTGLEVLTPIYEVKGLKDVVYKVTAKDDIVTADGTVRMNKGQSVMITTDENGVATSDYLYLGEYEVSEYSTPVGYKLNDKVENVTLDYRTNGSDSEGKLIVLDDYTVDLTYKNDRIPYELTFEKLFEDSKYNNTVKSAIAAREKVRFGIYAAEDIKAYNSNNTLIKKDALLDVMGVVGGKVTAKADLPVGSYYVKEIKVEGIPYKVEDTKYTFDFKPTNVEKAVLTINNGKAIENKIDKGHINFLKVDTKVYNANKTKIDNIVKNNDVNAFNTFAQENGLNGAKYQVYFDDEDGNRTALTEDGENVVFVSGENGIDNKDLPYGTYFLKETEAPENYDVNPDYVEVKVEKEVNITIVNDPKTVGKITVKHVDEETGKEIYDQEHYEDEVGQPYTTTDRVKEINEKIKEIRNQYNLVEEKIPDNKDGVYKKEEQTIIYYYHKKEVGKIIVKHVDDENGEEIYEREISEDEVGKPYTTTDRLKEINEKAKLPYDPYELVIEKMPDNKDGVYQKEEQTIIYYYHKKTTGKIVVKHIDEDTGKEIYDPEHSENLLGVAYETTDRLKEINEKYTPDFDIYELVIEKMPENNKGVYEEEEQTIIYYYKRLKGEKLTIIKKDAETGDRLEGCVFTIEDYITGEVLVKDAVTDKNGEFVVENVPYGRYVFTEVKAPEGYEVEEGSGGAIFDVKSKETVFEVVNTGDIAVVAISGLLLVSVAGVVIARKRILAK